MIQLDTTILVDVLRGHPAAVEFVTGLQEPIGISVITVAELYVGVRASEEDAIRDLIAAIPIWLLDLGAARQGGEWRQKYGPSHNVSLVDALIAATARQHEARLATINLKHFPMLPDVFMPYGP
jgi:predicted nucleic acid-binding protein